MRVAQFFRTDRESRTSELKGRMLYDLVLYDGKAAMPKIQGLTRVVSIQVRMTVGTVNQHGNVYG